uniref:Uncharacterized protein n=1 Tax=Leersia perrieri TaxID=77586 RepID=A0A0D9X7S7_9ORYZ
MCLLKERGKMYVTRPISRYHDNPATAAELPLDGPGSGILVVEDEAYVERATRWWGLCLDREVYGLPAGCSRWTHMDRDEVVFVPVVGHPLSSGRYYAVRATGRHAGKESACSREEDKMTCCFCSCVKDVPPRPFDIRDVYQHVKVVHLPRQSGFKAVAIASDDTIIVGRWYCPFMFIKEDGGVNQLKDQAKWCMFYEMTLEQNWKEIYSCENIHRGSIISYKPDEVKVSVMVRRSTALLDQPVHTREGGPQVVGGLMWFRPAASSTARGLGLEMVVWEQMKWELEKGGWMITCNGNVEMIERVERPDGVEQWEKFRCYMLVDRFVLKRMNGGVALTYEFKHANKIWTKWALLSSLAAGGIALSYLLGMHGKWFEDHVKLSMFYEMTLEQS